MVDKMINKFWLIVLLQSYKNCFCSSDPNHYYESWLIKVQQAWCAIGVGNYEERPTCFILCTWSNIHVHIYIICVYQ